MNSNNSREPIKVIIQIIPIAIGFSAKREVKLKSLLLHLQLKIMLHVIMMQDSFIANYDPESVSQRL